MYPQMVERRLVREPDEMTHVLPGVEFRVVPTQPGPFECSTTTIRLGSILLQTGFNKPYMAFATSRPGNAVVQLPLENAEALLLNGVAGFRGILGTYGGGAELLRTSLRPCRHSALILSMDAADALLEPPPDSALLRSKAYAFLRPDTEALERASRIIRAAQDTADTCPGIFEEAEARRALRDSLLGALRPLLRPPSDASVAVAPRGAAARRRIVAAADEFLRLHIERPVYTEDLCDALGVSASSLADAFRGVFAVSPHRFLKLRRLALVRAALRMREGPVPLVKTIALSNGFWHLGQFSHDYRAAFGEMPSETLARVCGDAGTAAPTVH